MKKIHLIKEEYIKCGDCNKHYLCTTCGTQCGSEGHFIESTEKETTLDEAAERSYSEKEVLAMLIIKHDGLSAEYVLEQFKKK